MSGALDPAGHYATLGVAASATGEELRAAYLGLARRHHPDRLGHRSAEEQRASASRMARINEAWGVLGDPARRAAYDNRPLGGAGATIRDVGPEFHAFDDSRDDWIDPRLLDDNPTGASDLGRLLTFLPAILGVAGLATVLFGLVMRLGALAGVGVLLLVSAGLAFVLIPVVAMVNSSRADRQ